MTVIHSLSAIALNRRMSLDGRQPTAIFLNIRNLNVGYQDGVLRLGNHVTLQYITDFGVTREE